MQFHTCPRGIKKRQGPWQGSCTTYKAKPSALYKAKPSSYLHSWTLMREGSSTQRWNSAKHYKAHSQTECVPLLAKTTIFVFFKCIYQYQRKYSQLKPADCSEGNAFSVHNREYSQKVESPLENRFCWKAGIFCCCSKSAGKQFQLTIFEWP